MSISTGLVMDLRVGLVCCVVLAAVSLTACSGGSGSPTAPPPIGESSIEFAATPPSPDCGKTLRVGDSYTVMAQVENHSGMSAKVQIDNGFSGGGDHINVDVVDGFVGDVSVGYTFKAPGSTELSNLSLTNSLIQKTSGFASCPITAVP
jgi:hypothetical protein